SSGSSSSRRPWKMKLVLRRSRSANRAPSTTTRGPLSPPMASTEIRIVSDIEGPFPRPKHGSGLTIDKDSDEASPAPDDASPQGLSPGSISDFSAPKGDSLGSLAGSSISSTL